MTTRHWILASTLFAAGYTVMATTAVVAQAGCFPCSTDQQCEEDCCAPGTIATCGPQNSCKCVIQQDPCFSCSSDQQCVDAACCAPGTVATCGPQNTCECAPPECSRITVASNSFPNVDGSGNMSAACYDGTPGAVSRSWNSDDVWQCAQEVPRPKWGKILEHLWEFPNVPPGRQFVQFEGHKREGLDDNGFVGDAAVADDFIFLSNAGPAGTPCPTDLQGGVYLILSSGDDYATFIHDTADTSGTLLVSSATDPQRICIMAMSVKTCPAEPPCRFRQIDSRDTQRDLVEMDRLTICTDLCDDGIDQCQ